MAALRVNSAETHQNRYAVVVGINKYQDPAIPDLVYARADAEAVYQVLTDPQFGGIPEENIILLLDEAATQREIRKSVGTILRQKVGEEDVVYIYYAGHGSPEIDPNGQSSDGLEKYLVPHDGEADDLFSSAISMEETRKFFQRLVAKQIIFFLDSCYSGEAGGRTFPDPRFRARNLSGEFLEDLGGEGRLVITACNVNEVSLELNNLKHGLFTYHLIEGMRGKADRDEDGLVSIDELYQYLYRNVSREARRLGGSMRPMRKGSAVGDLYITKYQTEAQKEAEKLRPRAREETKRENLETAALSWRDILKLLPDDEEAHKFLTSIEKQQWEAEEEKQRLLERRQGVLLDYYHRGELSAEAFSRAMELLPREKTSLTETEHRIHKLLADLADGKITLPVYRSSIALIDKGLADRSEEELDRKAEEKKRKTAKERKQKTQGKKIQKAQKEGKKKKAEEAQRQKAEEDSQKPAYFLRSSPVKNLSEQAVEKMLKEKNFFDKYINKNGKGITHQYQVEDVNGDVVVIDHTTGLIWQQSGSSDNITYRGAKKYIDQLNQEQFAGFNDWRLPTLEEAMSLIEPTQKNGELYVDPVFDKTQLWIWTSDLSSASSAWYIYFDVGSCGIFHVDDDGYIRAVRFGQSS